LFDETIEGVFQHRIHQCSLAFVVIMRKAEKLLRQYGGRRGCERSMGRWEHYSARELALNIHKGEYVFHATNLLQKHAKRKRLYVISKLHPSCPR
jgi:hypothetical protein